MARVPTQKRSKRTREALLAAAAELFEESAFEGTTTTSIAERAGVSVGSLYAYFKDKRTILLELARTETKRDTEAIIEDFSRPEVLEALEASREDAVQGVARAAIEAAERAIDINPTDARAHELLRTLRGR